MAYAFARDGGMPAFLSKVSKSHGVPVAAIWMTAILTLASTVYAPAYTTLTTACVIFLYISYVMPTMVGIFAYGKSWKKMGPFDLGGALYKLTGLISIVGVAAVVWAGIQPPNDAALPVTAGLAVLLTLAWHLGIKKVFLGPPSLLGDNAAKTAKSRKVLEPDFV
jgi:amino acid transporter